MIEDPPVLETEIIKPSGVDLSLYCRIGEEVTGVVRHKPGMLYVKEIIRPKHALRDNTQLPPEGQQGVEIAPMPLMPVDKRIADATLLAGMLLQKYEYHVPFYRQIRQHRHLGMKGLTESTPDGWFKKTVGLLKPLYEVLKQEGFSCDYLQADETTVPVINREKHKADKEYLRMVRSVMEKPVIFHYDKGSRAGAVIESLANQYHFKGYLQCDGFAGYETAFKTNPGVQPVNCLVHIRRHFEQALDENKEMAEHGLTRTQHICKIERCRDKAGLSHDVNPRDYLNDVIARMPYHKKATREVLLNLLPHKWKLPHPEGGLTKQTAEAGN